MNGYQDGWIGTICLLFWGNNERGEGRVGLQEEPPEVMRMRGKASKACCFDHCTCLLCRICSLEITCRWSDEQHLDFLSPNTLFVELWFVFLRTSLHLVAGWQVWTGPQYGHEGS